MSCGEAGHAVIGAASTAAERTEHLPAGWAFAGFVDAHAHLGHLGAPREAFAIDPDASVAAIVDEVERAAQNCAEGAWIVARGWRHAGERPREVLSRAAPRHPVCLQRIDGHALWLNDEALHRAGIGSETREPAGGRIGRDATGALDGLLIDAAMQLALHLLPRPHAHEMAAILRAEAQRFLAAGVSCVHELAVDTTMFEAFAELQRASAGGSALPLGLRVRAYAMPAARTEAERVFGRASAHSAEDWLRVRGFKLFADGALGSQGARLSIAYPDGGRGLRVDGGAHMQAVFAQAAELGWAVAIHAIGDAAVDELLLLIESEPGWRAEAQARRWRLEHLQVLPEALLARIRAAGLAACVQPTHATSDLPWAASLLGPLVNCSYPWRRLLEAGVPLGCGSDHPIEPIDVPASLHALCSRRAPDGPALPGRAERLGRWAALRLWSEGGAWLGGDEHSLGRLALGFAADFAVWDRDLARCPLAELGRARCLAMVVGGSLVWEA